MASSSTGIKLTQKEIVISDIGRFLELWNTQAQAPICDVRNRTPEGVAYNLTLFDVLQNLTRKVYVRIPADKKDSLKWRTGEHGPYFFISDPDLKRQIHELSDPFAAALQEKCTFRQESPDVQFPEFLRWPWKGNVDPGAFMQELHSDPRFEAQLMLNGAYHNTKDGKNIVTLEWVVSQYVQKPLVPKVRPGKKRAAAEISADVPVVESESAAEGK